MTTPRPPNRSRPGTIRPRPPSCRPAARNPRRRGFVRSPTGTILGPRPPRRRRSPKPRRSPRPRPPRHHRSPPRRRAGSAAGSPSGSLRCPSR
ncbi:MAG: hypothetical protein EBX35_00645 [Planctomycetia bacterium]|nr:hypothetical protein [Planctomycetia bacterium]